jgi:glycosyltransferase involved in cell wall biosynthesis
LSGLAKHPPQATYHSLHITPYYAPAYAFGGVVRSVEGLTQALAQRGHRISILTTDALSLDQRYEGKPAMTPPARVQVHRVPNALYRLRRLNLSTPWGWRATLRDLLPQVDLVHLHEFRTVENLLTVPRARQHQRPIILTPHGTMTHSTGRSALKAAWDALVSPQIAPAVRHIIALAPSERDDIAQVWRWSPVDYSVIPNGIDPAAFAHLPDDTAFRQQYGISTGRVVLFMGRLHARKGVEVLVRAFKQANIADTTLVLAGPDEGLRATLMPLLDERITLTGYLDGETRLAALASADLFALPAIGEGLSMAVLEAMASGVAVLLSPGCNLPQVTPADAGRIVAPEVDALADALRDLLADSARLRAMGAHARQLVQEQFTWARVAAQVEAVYRTHLA